MASQATSLAFQGFMQQWHSWEAMVLFCSIVTEVAYCAHYGGSWVRGADKGRHWCGQSVAQPAAPKPTESEGAYPHFPCLTQLFSLLYFHHLRNPPPPIRIPTRSYLLQLRGPARRTLVWDVLLFAPPLLVPIFYYAKPEADLVSLHPHLLSLLVFEIAVANSTRCTRRHGIPATIGQSDPKLTDGPACSCCDRSHRRPSHQLSWLVWCLSTRNKGGKPIEAADQRKSRRREDGDIQRTTAQRKATTDGLRSSRFAR